MELKIVNCIGCAVVGKPLDLPPKKDDFVEVTSAEFCSKCGKEIKIRGVYVGIKRKFFGGLDIFVKWH